MITRNGIERELERLVQIAKETIPRLVEIRIFGSYNNGNWNPNKSDVDVFIQVRGIGGICPYYKHQTYDMDQDMYDRFFPHELFEREVQSRLSKDLRLKFDIKVLDWRDVIEYSDESKGKGRGVAKDMISGRLLYSVSRASLRDQLRLLRETFIPRSKLIEGLINNQLVEKVTL